MPNPDCPDCPVQMNSRHDRYGYLFYRCPNCGGWMRPDDDELRGFPDA